ncbi:uncharacterized protein F4812DRAFT_455400 [Daldinia caldariorum]|uniref:uncharacterized protein n=1 Tax=Daldinia caldariorum TaxID=326644 RepID=UPI002007BCC7|nr:uncharacterized protein F4812DRAFT_455400 [Daldinia caldariorum]KAI1471287.1 hypothetical protein F4812DRAFT_455400 [Daldinia caldariorum]
MPVMAEILSIVAAVAQFLDMAIRLSMKISWVCSEVRGAPKILDDLRISLDQQIGLVKNISRSQLHQQGTLVGNVVAITAILVHYQDLMQNVLELLQPPIDHTDKNFLRKGWNVILTLHKKNDILHLCKQIEEQRDLVMLWLSNENLICSTETLDISRVF